MFEKRSKFFALSDEGKPRHFCFFVRCNMATDATLSVFVDESGRFQLPDRESSYYIVSLVMHNQRVPIDGLVAELDRHFAEMRLSNVCFHAGPRNFKRNYLRFVKAKEI